MIRLVASDLDGTLFGPDHVPEPRTVAAVNAVVEAGITFVAVTGRSHFGGAELAQSTGATMHWFIGSNGGHRLNLTTGVLEERLVFEREAVEEMTTELPKRVGGVGFGREHESGFSFDERFLAHHPITVDGNRRRSTTSGDRLDDVGKIFVSHPDTVTADLVDLIIPHVSDDVHVTTSGTTFVEITPAGADKGTALARLCGEIGVDRSEVIAFGDNHNDVTMLEWAHRGVAMGNAVDPLVAIADDVTSTNAECGVAEVLERLLTG